MQKLMINQAIENMGLHNTQMIATIFDGITRHSPEGVWFKKRAEEAGFKCLYLSGAAFANSLGMPDIE
jgi:enoyl-CoA hydratase